MPGAEAVVPTAVPRRQHIGVLLIGIGELGAGQRLDVDVAVGIDIGAERNRALRVSL